MSLTARRYAHRFLCLPLGRRQTPATPLALPWEAISGDRADGINLQVETADLESGSPPRVPKLCVGCTTRPDHHVRLRRTPRSDDRCQPAEDSLQGSHIPELHPAR